MMRALAGKLSPENAVRAFYNTASYAFFYPFFYQGRLWYGNGKTYPPEEFF
jgi:hypothetical protein